MLVTKDALYLICSPYNFLYNYVCTLLLFVYIYIGVPEDVNVVGELVTWKPPTSRVSGYVVKYHAVGDVQRVELEVEVPYVTLPVTLKGNYSVEVCSNKKKIFTFFITLCSYTKIAFHINICQIFL